MLTVIRGKVSRGEIAFRPPAVLGRSREADLTVAHPMISRQHCELYEVDGLLMVRDLGSLNGTVVGEQRVVEAALCPDDCFSVGPLTFQVQYEYSGDREATPPPKLAEPGAAQAPTGEPAPTGPPVFSEITPPEEPRPTLDDGPWANPMADEDDGPWANAMPAEGEPEFVPTPDAGPAAKPSRRGRVMEPTLRDTAGGSSDDDPEENGGREAEADDAREGPVAAKASQPKTEKRGWKLWPFGRKPSKARESESPAAEAQADAADAEGPEEAAVAPAPAMPGTPDAPQDAAVADFLAEPPESEEAEEAESDDQAAPARADDDHEDDAFDDFLKGLQ